MSGAILTRNRLRYRLGFAVFCYFQGVCLAQEVIGPEQKRAASEVSEISGLPVLFRTPETGLGVGAVGIYLPERSHKKHSPLLLGFMLTEKKQFLLAGGTKQYFHGDRYALLLYAELLSYPKQFFGIGGDTRLADEDWYHEKRVLVDGGFEAMVWQHLALGLSFSVRSDRISELDPSLVARQKDFFGEDGGQQAGLGSYALYDSTQDPFYPRRGIRLSIDGLSYLQGLRSDFPMRRYTFDLRYYMSPRSDLVWANQVFLRTIDGDVPFYQLAEIGGHSRLRGYIQGRYRDGNAAVWQSEFRYDWSQDMALVGFVGLGDVAASVESFRARLLKPSYGFGGRYQLAKAQKINLRLDIGAGTQSSADPKLYLYVMEAF